MAANNFAEAKRHGFVPSYPAGAGPQGPRPEPWEFVYVGVAPLIDTSEYGQLDTITVTEGRVTVTGAFAGTEQSIEIFIDETRVAVATAGCVEADEPGRFRLAASVAPPLPPSADVCVIGDRSATRRLLGCLP